MGKLAFIIAFVFSLSGALNMIRNVLDPLKSCRLVLHAPLRHWSDSFTSFYLTDLAAVHGGATLVTAAEQWRTSTMIGSLWDSKSHCVVHLSLQGLSLNQIIGDLLIKFQRESMAEHEYFITGLGDFALYQLKSDSQLLTTLRTFIQNIILLELSHESVTSQEEEHSEIRRALQAQLYCSSNSLACLVPVDTEVGNSFKMTVSGKIEMRRVNYNGWPLHILFTGQTGTLTTNIKRVTGLPLWYIIRPPFEFLAYLGTAKICSHIGLHLNATLVPMRDFKGHQPTSVVTPSITLANLHTVHRSLVHSMEHLNFVYCHNPELPSFLGYAGVYFAPFDVPIWLLILISATTMCIILKAKLGSTFLLETFGAVLGQVHRIPHAFRWTFSIWVASGFLLGTMYTNFIESLLVVPTQIVWLADFEQLHKAGYTVVLADSPGEVLGDIFRDIASKLEGNSSYLKELAQSAEYIQAPYGPESAEYLDYAVLERRKAIVVGSQFAGMVLEMLKIKFPQKSCRAGNKPVMFDINVWAGSFANGAIIRRILHELYAGGILQLFERSAEENLERFSKKNPWRSFHRHPLAGLGLQIRNFFIFKKQRMTNNVQDGFVMENAQMQFLFHSWLGALGLSCFVFFGEFVCNRISKIFKSWRGQKRSPRK